MMRLTVMVISMKIKMRLRMIYDDSA